MNAIDIYTNAGDNPRLSVLQHVIIRAVRSLPHIEALALIRGAYAMPDGSFASLEEAKQIYEMIMVGSEYTANYKAYQESVLGRRA